MNEAKRRLLVARAMNDLAAAQSAIVVRLADATGFFAEMRRVGRITIGEIATTCRIPLLQAEYMATTLAASGYVEFDPAEGRFYMAPEQESLFADSNDELFLAGAFQLAVGLAAANHASEVEDGIRRSSRAKFPPLIARQFGEKLAGPLLVADVGCGYGETLLELARRFPNMRGTGVECCDRRIDAARAAAAALGVAERISFITNPTDLPAGRYDIVVTLEAFHEFVDTGGVAKAVHNALRPDGVWFLIEPCISQRSTPTARRFLASLGCLYCLPSTNFDPGVLGPLSDRLAYQRVLSASGFRDIRVLDEGTTHATIEARP